MVLISQLQHREFDKKKLDLMNIKPHYDLRRALCFARDPPPFDGIITATVGVGIGRTVEVVNQPLGI